MINAMEWFERARKLMKSKGIVYATLAEDFGVSTATVGHWMKGTRDPCVRDFKKIATYLDTTASHLLGEDDTYIPTSKKGMDAAKIVDEMKSEEQQDMAIKFVTTIAESKGNHGSAPKRAKK